MIISHQYQFIFIKNCKTAGTSIEVFLSQLCAPTDVVTPIYPPVEPHSPRNHEGFYNHMTGAEIRERIGDKLWNDYFKFCVERNPWDKALSYYHMVNARAGGALSLDAFLAGQEFPVNYPRYTEPEDSQKIIVDRVIDYDNLTEGLSEVFAKLGIPFEGTLGVHAKSDYRSDRRPYQQVLSTAQAERIRAIFAEEISLQGYSFNQVHPL